MKAPKTPMDRLPPEEQRASMLRFLAFLAENGSVPQTAVRVAHGKGVELHDIAVAAGLTDDEVHAVLHPS